MAKLWATAADLPGLVPAGELWIDPSATPEEREAIIAEHLPPAPPAPPAPPDPIVVALQQLAQAQQEHNTAILDALAANTAAVRALAYQMARPKTIERDDDGRVVALRVG